MVSIVLISYILVLISSLLVIIIRLITIKKIKYLFLLPLFGPFILSATIIAVTLLVPRSRAQCTICMLHFDLAFFIYFIYISFFMSFRDAQELGGGVVFPCGSISALVVPARHVR